MKYKFAILLFLNLASIQKIKTNPLKTFLKEICSSNSSLEDKDYDIYTGVLLKDMPEPSTGLNEPKDSWLKGVIKSIKSSDIIYLKRLLKSAFDNKIGPMMPLFYTPKEVVDVLISHKLGDRSTVYDISQKSNNNEIKLLFAELKYLAESENRIRKLLE